jgi:hypothetical protein
MGHSRISEGPDHMYQGIGVLVGGDVNERFRASRLTRCRQVRELDRCRYPLLRVVHRRQAIKTGVGDLGDADRSFHLTVTAASRFLRARHELKQRGLPARRETYERSSQHDKP